MATPIRVLIVEDRVSDAELMAHELKRGGFDPDWKRVETEADYLKELSTLPDIILADHTLPDFSAPRALALLKERNLDIPLIVVTGSISEEVAVERIKQGAADYILKDRMVRLGAAVRRALEEKKLRDQRKSAEDETKRNLHRIRALHEIDAAISSTLDLRAVLDVLLEKIGLFFPLAAASTVRLLGKQTGELEPVACRNLDEREWKAATARIPGGVVRLLPKDNAPVAVRNAQTDPRSLSPELLRKYGLVSYLRVPLAAKGNLLGMLTVFAKEEHEFSAEEIEFLTTLAGQAAIGIHNSQLYEEMAKLAADLSRSNKVKDEFLSVMSHELRTPLNVVVGYVAMIKDGMLGVVNPKQEEALGKVIARANDQLALVNNILYATVIETEKITVESHAVVLGDFLNQLKISYQAPVNKDLALRWNCPEPLRVVHTDSAKLRQVLQNLIDNAVKFTPKGTITISVKVPEGSRQAEFRVADTGVGIPEEHLPNIFDKFRQADSSETRLFGGVGMGLYIVKKFAELLGGEVEVKSELGKGSVFTVMIPCG